MHALKDQARKPRHFSTIGIEDVFLSPSINTRYLPQTYNSPHFQGETRTFISPEIVGTIKAQPEDFVVRELASDHLGLPPEWREADLRNLPPEEQLTVAEVDQHERSQTDIELSPCIAGATNQEERGLKHILDVEEDLNPADVVRKVLETNHPKTFQVELAGLEALNSRGKTLALSSGVSVPTGEEELVIPPPLPSDSTCLDGVSVQSGPLCGGDRGSLHRNLKLAYPFLRSDTIRQDDDVYVKVLVDSSYFEIASLLHDPLQSLEALYRFRNRGIPRNNRAESTDPPPFKKHKSYRGNFVDGGFAHLLLPLRDGLSKEDRRKIHRSISSKEMETSTISFADSDGATSSKILVKWSTAARRAALGKKGERQRSESTPKSFQLMVVKKRQKEHLAAIQALLKMLHIKRQSDIGLAGIKDMYAVTYQFCTIRGEISDSQVVRANGGLRDVGMEISVMGRVRHFLQKGDLHGNHFVIRISNVKRVQIDVVDGVNHESMCHCNKQEVLQRVTEVQKYGFVNFYGEQRVGIAGEPDIVGIRSFDIGRAMLQGNFDKAVDLLMTGRLLCRDDEVESPEVRRARQVWIDTGGSAVETFKALPSGEAMARERIVLKGLKRYQNALDAFRCLHFQVRMFWINSYQSFIWNQVASARLRMFGAKAIAGDLIRNRDGNIATITEDDVASTPFHAVVLPLPGTHVRYPENEIGHLYVRLLADDKVSFDNDGPIESTAKGSYRNICILVRSLQIDFPDKLTEDSAIDEFQISFDLPAGSYATMLTRELLATTVTR
jgi:TruD family tRNA pseudouridine synthase